MEIQDLNKYKNQIINILIVAVALIIGSSLYKHQAKKAESLKARGQEAISINQLLSEISASEKEINSYKDLLGLGDVSVVINEINAIARQAQVKVSSIRPLSETAFKAYVKQELEVSVSAPDSHQIGRFVSGLENSKTVFIIESFNEISSQRGGSGYSQQAGAGEEINARITLGAIFIRG